MGKSPKDRRGTAQDGHFVSIFALPPVPRYVGRSPGRLCVISGAQNLSGGLNSYRATGPWLCKNCNRCGSRTAPGFTQPTLSVHILAGAPRGSPTLDWRAFLRFVGEGLNVNCPTGTRVSPTKERDGFQLHRRGGCPHPPVVPHRTTCAPPQQRRSQQGECLTFGCHQISSSERRGVGVRLVHPRLCDNGISP